MTLRSDAAQEEAAPAATGMSETREPSTRAQRSALEWVAIALVATYALAAGLSLLGNTVNIFDESLQLQGGRLVLEGWIPNRDFWSLYPPLNYFVNALAFAVLETSVVSARLTTLLIHATACVMIVRYLDLRLRFDHPVAKSGALLLSVFLLSQVLALSAANPVLFAMLVVTHHLTEIARGRASTRKSLILSGTLSGLVLMTRINLGLYVIASISCDLFLAALRRQKSWQAGLREAWGTLAYFGSPAVALFATYLLYTGPRDSLEQIAGALPQILRAGLMIDPTTSQDAFWALAGIVGLCVLSAEGTTLHGWRGVRIRAGAFVAAVYLGDRLLGWLSSYDLLLVPFAIPFLLMLSTLVVQWRWQCYPRSVLVSLLFVLASFQYYLVRADIWHLWALGGGLCLVVAPDDSTPDGTRNLLFRGPDALLATVDRDRAVGPSDRSSIHQGSGWAAAGWRIDVLRR